METFSDGVIAIIITIMVLELKVPHDSSPAALVPLVPVLLSYVLSFIFLGIYWSNHHHLCHAIEYQLLSSCGNPACACEVVVGVRFVRAGGDHVAHS